MTNLPVPPHASPELKTLFVSDDRKAELRQDSCQWPSWDLTARQLCDLELLMTGAMTPLEGFMGRTDYDGVLKQMRLSDGTLWPVPIVLDITEELAEKLSTGTTLALRCPEGVMLAALHIDDIWKADLTKEAEEVYKTTDPDHPGVHFLFNQINPYYIGGKIEGIEAPKHYDFCDLRMTPGKVRERLVAQNKQKVVAFQTRNPMHRAHKELTARAAAQLDASVLIHPVVGLTRPGDIDHYTRVRCYQQLLKHYNKDQVDLALLPLSMRMAGPREAIWHAIIRKNFGCSHLIVGRDHAAPGDNAQGIPYYGPYEAQDLLKRHEEELGIQMVPFEEIVYLEKGDKFVPRKEIPEGETAARLSGTELRRRLMDGTDIPEWFSYPEVIQELRRTHPSRKDQGLTLFFTGLSGAGKSTIANAVFSKLLEIGGRSVSLLDGDIVRKHLSSELGFSREHRNLNVRRIAYVASEITKNGGVAICAPIAPYNELREEAREMIKPHGTFILIHIATPLDVCEQRDRKGLYAKARAGLLDQFTGISDPYEVPANPEITIDTSNISIEQGLQQVVDYLVNNGYVEDLHARELTATSR